MLGRWGHNALKFEKGGKKKLNNYFIYLNISYMKYLRVNIEHKNFIFLILILIDRSKEIIFYKKRFYTRGTLRGTRISRLAKISTVYRDSLRSLIR